MTDAFLVVHQGTVISLAARNNVPVIGADFPSKAACCHMDLISRIYFAVQLNMSIEYYGAKNPPICRCSNRRNLISASISRLLRHSA
jgi:hypothetical protein